MNFCREVEYSDSSTMAPVSLKKTIQQYKSLSQSLESKLQQLYTKREELESRAFVVIEESPRPSPANSPAQNLAMHMQENLSSLAQNVAAGVDRGELRRKQRASSPPSLAVITDTNVEKDAPTTATLGSESLEMSSGNPTASVTQGTAARGDRSLGDRMPSLIEETTMAHSSDISSLVSTATNILIESMQLRVSYVQEALTKLTSIQQENPKLPTPPELVFSRFEEWVQTNQRLFELNVQLYDLEKLKFELKEKRLKVTTSPKERQEEVEKTLTGERERERERTVCVCLLLHM